MIIVKRLADVSPRLRVLLVGWLVMLPLPLLWFPTWSVAGEAVEPLRLAMESLKKSSSLDRQQAWDQSATLLQTAQDRLEKSGAGAHPLSLAIFSRLGKLESRRHHPEVAWARYTQARSWVEKHLQPDSLFASELMREMATLSAVTKSPPGTSSARLRGEAALIDAARVGLTSPGKGEALKRLGEVAEGEGRTAAAIENDTQALRILSAQPGPYGAARLELALKLARLHTEKGEPEAAVEALRTALTVAESMWGNDHPVVVPILTALATNLLAQKKGQQGQPYVARLMTVARATWGIDHPKSIRASIIMVDYLLADGELEQASQILHGLQLILDTPAFAHGPELPMVRERLARVERPSNQTQGSGNGPPKPPTSPDRSSSSPPPSPVPAVATPVLPSLPPIANDPSATRPSPSQKQTQ
ncbi:MAG: tetratricopeptide repeat protein [Magnetococcales bacterium]|nr:tetratricopeptide repeat protein [Magnetococcales bacterium]